MLQHELHVGGLPQDAHVRQNAVVHQIVSSGSVAAIFFALVLAPLRFFDLAAHRANDDVTSQTDSGSHQRFDGV